MGEGRYDVLSRKVAYVAALEKNYNRAMRIMSTGFFSCGRAYGLCGFMRTVGA